MPEQARPVEIAEAWLRHTVQTLVDHPEQVMISVASGTQADLFEVTVNPSDVRRVLGRRGQTADSIRRLLHCVGAGSGRRFQLGIVDPRTP